MSGPTLAHVRDFRKQACVLRKQASVLFASKGSSQASKRPTVIRRAAIGSSDANSLDNMASPQS